MSSFVLLFWFIISIELMTSENTNSSICISKGVLGDLRGPYTNIGFNQTLNGNIYEFSRPQKTLYLYPHIVSSSTYYWLISETIYSSTISTYCYIGYQHENYLFDIDDCQYWTFYNKTADELQVTNTQASMCQWNDICIENSKYLPHINTQYQFMHWNYTVNGAVYYNEKINKYIYPHRVINNTYAQYLIHETMGDSYANALCNIGTAQWYYSFNFDDCKVFRSWYRLEWNIEPNMTITNCSHNQETSVPTNQPTIGPTSYATVYPTDYSTTSSITAEATYDSSDLSTEHTLFYISESKNDFIFWGMGQMTIVIIGVSSIIILCVALIILIYYLSCKRNKQQVQEKVKGNTKPVESIDNTKMKISIRKSLIAQIQNALMAQKISGEADSDREEFSQGFEGEETAEI